MRAMVDVIIDCASFGMESSKEFETNSMQCVFTERTPATLKLAASYLQNMYQQICILIDGRFF